MKKIILDVIKNYDTKNVIQDYPDGTFAPKQFATRSEAAVMSYRLLVKLGTITDAELPENIILSKNIVKQGDLLKISIHITQIYTIFL